MDDVVLREKIDESTFLYVSPISREAYTENVEYDNLGGEQGYFILRSHRFGEHRLEVLAKTPTFAAANELFDILVNTRRTISGGRSA